MTSTPKATSAEDTVKPGRKPGQKAREYDFSGLSASFLAVPAAVSEEVARKAAPRAVRSDAQLAVDKVVKDYHQQWIAAGKPDAWAKMPKGRYDLPPVQAEAVRYLLRKAADFHSVAVKFGQPVPVAGGKELVVFAVRDKRTAPGRKPAADSNQHAASAR